jgi:hypothetical protein
MPRNYGRHYYYRAVQKLSGYFGVLSAADLSNQIAFEQLAGNVGRFATNDLGPSPEEAKIVDLVINTRDGALPVIDETVVSPEAAVAANVPVGTIDSSKNDLVTALSYLSRRSGNGVDSDLERRISRLVKLHHSTRLHENSYSFADIGEMLNKPDDDYIAKRLSAVEIFSPFISPSGKESEGLSIFFNGIPQIELARMVPFLDVKFMFGKNSADYDGNLSAPSIFKFLEGAVKVRDNSTMALLVKANETAGTIEGASNDSGRLPSAGMELFTSPQTMVNADTPNPKHNRLSSEAERGLRSTSVIDKFRPFLSFKTLTIDVAPSVGLISYKTGKMEFILHDRSRLHEIADLVKADLYGTTEIMIEYGWTHPDPPEAENPYADLYNCSRTKEKFGIRNSQFSFDEVGQVNITLELFTKGSSDIFTSNIATASESTRNSLTRIQELADVISRFRRALPNQSGNNSSREIRGIQALDSLSDIQSNIRLNTEIVDQVRQLRQSLGSLSGRNQDVSRLLGSLNEMFIGVNQSRAARTTNRALPQTSRTSALQQLSNSVQQELREQFRRLREGYDPFYPRDFELPSRRIQGAPVRQRSQQFRRVLRNGTSSGGAPRAVEGQNISTAILNEFNNDQVSLGKILMTFIGQPLAATGKYDEVQFLFYPMNNYAGYARFLHTGEFMVDLRYMIDQYFRFRMESISRAANVNLNDFTLFLQSNIIDDNAAPVYGIDDLFEKTVDRNSGATQTTARFDSVRLQTEISDRLRNITPDGTFKMPEIQLYIETLPRKNIRENSNSLIESIDDSKTILRIHVYDKQSTQYEGLGALLETARDSTLSAFSNVTTTSDSPNASSVIGQNQKAQLERIINSATSEGLIELITPSPSRRELNSDGRYTYYKFTGNQGRLKEFMMKTMPYIIYGCTGTTLQTAQLTSQNDPALSSINMQRSVNANPQRANGEQPGGLPIQIIPAELSVACLGNTNINLGQRIFIDFQTGTTVDNIYVVNGLSHTIGQGEFKTDIKFVFYDGYGKYRSFIDQVNAFAVQLDDIARTTTNTTNPLLANR